MNDQLDDMYRDIILDHYRSPRGKKPVDTADISSEGMNPSCGDEIDMQVELGDGLVKDIHVNCRGCAISVASGSMLAEISKGKSLDELIAIAEVVKKMLKGEIDEIPEELGDIDALQGVKQFPVRIKCALLSWVTFLEGVKNYKDKDKSEKASTSTEEKK
ncbi:MAG: SUF system NifU family Fe-S cluster assembly protein [candidate division Zixibacteria bacterium]|nr:SUF system NifU family Fe-S cluster assembly protein [candidate division Zixibacteria bacterium]